MCVENSSKSSITDNSDFFPKFDREQLRLGKLLGKGSFGTVYEVKEIQILQKRRFSQAGTESQFVADNCIRKGNHARYAVKFLSPEVVGDVGENGKFIRGILDMDTEKRLLSDTEHPNIVKARAFASVSPFDRKYFILMDRLYDTLHRRMERWAKKARLYSGRLAKIVDRKGKKKRELLEARLVAAFDLSHALGYLHDRKIIYRDLKPKNLGFDVRGDLKLFDFGLVGEMKDSRLADEGLYNLTGMTGCPRYMSPEVAKSERYNEKCDVYSFAILLWEIMSLKTPFVAYKTIKEFEEHVWNGEHDRPLIHPSWPESIQTLLRTSWGKNINERPNFTEIATLLKIQCVVVRGGSQMGLEHSSRRSTFIFERDVNKLLDSIHKTAHF
uniref:Protein kinase domain-containing protein n=1 Tax=Pseudo-nitzschia australis TaxID=44445 RepID=A0A7S4AEU9_9STRA